VGENSFSEVIWGIFNRRGEEEMGGRGEEEMGGRGVNGGIF
jgi:hypothetical protein